LLARRSRRTLRPLKTSWKPILTQAAGWALVALLAHGVMLMFLGGAIDYVVSAILIAGAIALGLFKRGLPEQDRYLRRGVAILFVAFAVWRAVPQAETDGIPWQPYAPQLVEAARKGRKPVIIDFVTKNCAWCRAMDRNVFSRRKVVDASSGFLALRADFTLPTPELTKLATEYGIEAFPTVIFLDPEGNERRNLRLVGYERSESFLQRLQTAR
jgi:thiol:disulfide interchange protein